MPRPIKDDRVRMGKINRNRDISQFFEKLYNDGYRYEIIEERIILKWGLSSSTINKILKGYGSYEEPSSNAPEEDKRQLNLFTE